MPERDTWGGLFVLVLMYLSVVLDRLWLCVHGFTCLFCVFSTDWKTVDWFRMYFQSGWIDQQWNYNVIQSTSVLAILRLFIKWILLVLYYIIIIIIIIILRRIRVLLFPWLTCGWTLFLLLCVYRLANEYLLQNQSTLFQKLQKKISSILWS